MLRFAHVLRSRTRARGLPHRPVDRLHLWPIAKPALGHIECLAHMLFVRGAAERVDSPQNRTAVDGLLRREVVLPCELDEAGEAEQGWRTRQRPEGLVLYAVLLA